MSWIHYTSYKNYPSNPEHYHRPRYNDISKNINQGLPSAWSHREYIQKNANNIMYYNTTMMLKNRDSHMCPLNIINRDYSTYSTIPSDLKGEYLTKRTNSLAIVPTIPI